MIRRVISATAAVAVVAVSSLEAQDGPPSLSEARVAAQVGGGSLASPVAFFAGGLVTRRVARALGAGDETARNAAYVGAYTGVWLAAAAVPAAVGDKGRFPAALAGSALGMVTALGTVKLGNHLYDSERRKCDVLCWALGASVFALPSVGATIAYNASRHR